MVSTTRRLTAFLLSVAPGLGFAVFGTGIAVFALYGLIGK
jgi:hypothetical protein